MTIIPPRSPPSIEHMSILILKPPNTLSNRAFEFAFNRVDSVACHSSLPLKLWIIVAPSMAAPPFLQLLRRLRRRGGVGGAVGPHEAGWPSGSGGRGSKIRLYLHFGITVGL